MTARCQVFEKRGIVWRAKLQPGGVERDVALELAAKLARLEDRTVEVREVVSGELVATFPGITRHNREVSGP